MLADLARNWWVLLIRGILALVFGVLALVNPLVTIAVLITAFAVYAIMDGIFSITMSLTAHKRYRGWGWLLVSGVAGIIIGALTLLRPGVTAVLLLYWMMAWLIVTGVFQIAAGIRVRKEVRGEFWIILGGALCVLFGLYLMANPAVGALAVLSMIAFFAIMFGVLMILAAFRLRGLRGSTGQLSAAGVQEGS